MASLFGICLDSALLGGGLILIIGEGLLLELALATGRGLGLCDLLGLARRLGLRVGSSGAVDEAGLGFLQDLLGPVLARWSSAIYEVEGGGMRLTTRNQR